MLTNKLKRLALSVSAAALLVSSSAQAATSITVAVTPSLVGPIGDIVSAFQNAYPTSGYSVSVVAGPDATMETKIINGGASGPYDLFISQSAVLPLDLIYNHPSLVTGSQFAVAKDGLDLYSSASNPVDISAGLPTSGIQKFAFADPTTLDPWGIAASQVLGSKWAYAQAVAQGNYISTPSALAAYAETEYLGLAYAFVPKSTICTLANGVEYYEPGSFHYEYQLGVDYLNEIVLTGLQIAKTRTTDQQTELTNFVNFLTGVGSTAGTQYLLAHCYKLP